MNKQGYVYMMASRKNGTIYIGVTSKLAQRAYQHREGLIEGFTKKYDCKLLVWFEAHDTIEGARGRELQMKKWNRPWKIPEIETLNPEWRDLYPTLI
jgi:putative endonuclease